MSTRKVRRSQTCGDLGYHSLESLTTDQLPRRLSILGGIYDGQLFENKREGVGIMIDSSGNKYEGEWVGDKAEGWGMKIFSCGDRHEGNYVRGRREGWGQYFWTNGELYRGSWRNGKMHGQGTFHWSTGEVFSGRWKAGKMDGHGVKTLVDGGMLEGSFREGMVHGWARKRFSCGDTYEGFFRTDRRSGFGRYQWVNGDVTEGFWRSGGEGGGDRDAEGLALGHREKRDRVQTETVQTETVLEGRGRVTLNRNRLTSALAGSGIIKPTSVSTYGSSFLPSSEIIDYRGDFHQGLRHGHGEGRSADGTLYIGHWCRDRKHGWGKQWDGSGVYEGEFVDGMRQGHGCISWTDGGSYKGEWLQEKAHGMGQETETMDSDGEETVYIGQFENGVKHGVGTMRRSNGEVLVTEGVWREGLVVDVVTDATNNNNNNAAVT
eukprot:gene10008-20829_t